jgi:hypothetical protein
MQRSPLTPEEILSDSKAGTSTPAAQGRHTPGPWHRCFHLESAENDASCSCGYRGGIWGPDEEHTICEMGSTLIKGEEGLCPPRYPRDVELANGRLIAAAPDLLEALRLAENVLSRFPFSSEIWPDGTHPNAGISQIRAAIAKAEAS